MMVGLCRGRGPGAGDRRDGGGTMILSQEQVMIPVMARDFARDRRKPFAPECDRNGPKQVITSGENADVVIVFAVTNPAAGKKGISAFIVPTETQGYRVARLERKLGLHASDTAQLVFEEMALTPDLLLGGEGEG